MNSNDYAIIIGLQNYPGIGNLGGPENDARAFRDWVISPTGGHVPDDSDAPDDGAVHLQLILSSSFKPFKLARHAHPVVSEIQNAFLKLHEIHLQNIDRGTPRIGRRLYIYMAGHGIAPSASRAVNQYESALLMADASSLFYGSSYHIPGAYTASWFGLNDCFEEVYLFMDCCRGSESVFSINEFLPSEGTSDTAKRCYMFSTKWAQNARERAMPDEAGAVRGVFTKTLLMGLSGGALIADPANPGQGIITVSSLKGYIYENIRNVLANRTDADDSAARSLDTTGGIELQEPDIDYWPRKKDGKDIIILTAPMPIPELPVSDVGQIPGYMEDSHTPGDLEFGDAVAQMPGHMRSPQQIVALSVRTGDEATEIFILDGNNELVNRAVGNQAQFKLPQGMYTVKVKSGDTQQKKLINLDEDQTVEFEPAAFNSPAPLEGTGKTHEFHIGNAAAHSKQKNKELGEGSELYVFVRDWTTETRPGKISAAKTVKQPANGLTIRNLAGEILIDVVSDDFPGEKGWDPWKACNVALDPGTYLLTLKKPNGDLMQQTVTTCKGWQTQVFLLLKDYGKGPDSRRADLANASIYMAKLGLGFNPKKDTDENATARLTELARRGLVNNRRVLTEKTLREVLNSKFENPMLGIMGGHLLLLEGKKVNEDLLRVVVDNLRRMLGVNHPDVEALAIRAGIKSGYSFDAPPMLLSSWSILLRASANNPAIIPTDSLANEVADALWGGSPWLLWTLPARITRKDANARQQQMQEQLNRAVVVEQSPTGSVESMMPDMAPLQKGPVEPLSQKQLSRLVQTMGLPCGKIKQLMEAEK